MERRKREPVRSGKKETDSRVGILRKYAHEYDRYPTSTVDYLYIRYIGFFLN